MNRLAQKLAQGDMRSKGRSEQVVKQVLKDPALFPQLIEALALDHPGIRMRASDAIEKITRQQPGLLKAHKRMLIKLLALGDQQEMRWHLAQIVPRLDLTPAERSKVFATLSIYLEDPSSIVKTFAMQAMADLARQEPGYRARVRRLLKKALQQGTPAMQSRARKLLRSAEKTD